METTYRLAGRLEKSGLDITSVFAIENADQIRLECGAIINLFYTGTVVVQGKLSLRDTRWVVHLLQKLLPPETRFPPSMVPKIKAKPLIRDFDGNYVEADGPWFTADDGCTIEMEALKPKTAFARLPTPLVKANEVGQRRRDLLDL